jgi:3-methyl-2-oxobutanoate hydroxymethyltransferase
MGGYKVQGKKTGDVKRLLHDARELEKAGVFALVVECVPRAVGAAITAAVGVPTIGIGAGKDCDGQILVTHDVLGLYSELTPKFAKPYARLGAEMKKAFGTYKREVETGAFPGKEHSY